MTLRLVQVGLGALGRQIAADAIARGIGRVVAAVDPGAEAVGRPLGELVPGAGDARVAATIEEVQGDAGVDAAIVATASELELVMPTLRAALDRGWTVVSTCEELAWPWLRQPVLAQELDERAIRSGGRLLGTGVNPGFLMDALVVAVSTACARVRSVRVTRVQDAAVRRAQFQRKIGAGLDARAFAAGVADGSLRHVGLGESLRLVAHYLGLKVERCEETIEMIPAERDLECALGPIRAGSAAGVAQTARGFQGGACVVELVFRAAIGHPDPHERFELESDPPIDLVIRPGVHGDVATSAIVLNSIRALRLMPPGLHTTAGIPLQGCVQRPGRP